MPLFLLPTWSPGPRNATFSSCLKFVPSPSTFLALALYPVLSSLHVPGLVWSAVLPLPAWPPNCPSVIFQNANMSVSPKTPGWLRLALQIKSRLCSLAHKSSTTCCSLPSPRPASPLGTGTPAVSDSAPSCPCECCFFCLELSPYCSCVTNYTFFILGGSQSKPVFLKAGCSRASCQCESLSCVLSIVCTCLPFLQSVPVCSCTLSNGSFG